MTTTTMVVRATALSLAGVVLFAGTARGEEIKVMISGGFTAAYQQVIPEFERASHHRIATAFGASMGNAPDSIPSRLQRGEPVDVVILASSALDQLIAQGKVVAGSRVDLARSSIGIAVRAGAPKPDISSVDALRRTLLHARSIAYSASASGVYVSTELFEGLGIANEVRGKSKRIESERVGAVVARGDAEIGFQQISELLPVSGIDYVGPLPSEVQRVTVFSAGLAAGARSPEAARALVQFLASSATASAITKSGLELVTASDALTAPTVSGPIQGPGLMYPNPPVSIVPGAVKVEDFPYVTEEYFVSGTASGSPYTTRIIVRRPTNVSSFSGVVVGEALHAGGRSLIFEWSRLSILTRGHAFAEIVHSPANVGLLKAFNAERYAALNISAGQTNEIIAQFGRLMKSGGKPLTGYRVRHLTLMGTSASSGTVRAYLQDHPKLRMPDGAPIFDGFLLTSTNGNTPLPIVDVPMIQMPTQTEVFTWAEAGIAYRRPDSDAPGNRFRLYEVAGMPHNNSRDSPAFTRDPCTLPVTDFPAGAFTALALNHLIEWIAKGKTPPHAPYITVDQNPANDGSQLALDEFGNAKGGIRNVWVDMPIASYGVFGKGKTQAQDRLCLLAGTEVPLPEATLRKLYRDKTDYASRVERRLEELVSEGWFLPEYVEMVRADVKATNTP